MRLERRPTHKHAILPSSDPDPRTHHCLEADEQGDQVRMNEEIRSYLCSRADEQNRPVVLEVGLVQAIQVVVPC